MIIPLITNSLRFTEGDEAEDCSGIPGGIACISGGEGQPAFAIHLWNGRPFCADHSPAENIYVPCSACDEGRPAYKPENIEEDPLCQPCLRHFIIQAAEAQFLANAVKAIRDEDAGK